MRKADSMAGMVCPSREILHQYSLGLLAGEQRETLDSHLDSCPVCQATMVTLDDGGDTLVGHLRLPMSDESLLAEPQLQGALAALGLPGKLQTADVPQTLGEYRVLEALGRGGMGRVYKALQTKLDRIVALKVLPRGRLRDRQAIARFEREMKAIGRLAHPNIVQAHDAREIDGTPILVMEFVDGLDLSELVRRVGPLPVADACELMRQTALALQYAHEHGLVHRDIKPSNIMLARSGEVKLLDLGLARFYAEGAAGIARSAGGPAGLDSEEMTGTDQAMGTADYMAPEQVSDSQAVDIRADLYSLGCTLYKLLSGRAPFSGPGHRTTLEKLNAQVHEQPPLIRTLVPQVPDKLAAILDRLLAKDPNDRFAAPADVAEALAPWCRGAKLPQLLRRAEADRGEGSDPTEPLAASQRGKWIIRRTILLLLFAGFGGALGILLTIRRDGQQTTIELPEGSHTIVDAKGNVSVKLAEKPQETVAERQVFIAANSPYWETLSDMAERKGMVVLHSFNREYDRWLPAAKGHLLMVEIHQGVPIVPVSVLEKFLPGACEGLKKADGMLKLGSTKIAFVDLSRLLAGRAIESGSGSGQRLAFVAGNSPYWQVLTDLARRKGMKVRYSFNGAYDEWLPQAKGHVLLVETHTGVPIVPLSVLDKYYPRASDGLTAPDGMATVGTTKIIFVDFARFGEPF
jgi:serine/threonine protein kinase